MLLLLCVLKEILTSILCYPFQIGGGEFIDVPLSKLRS
jgi:hypothetical protein